MKNNNATFLCLLYGIFGLIVSLPVFSASTIVDCPNDSLQAAIDHSVQGDTLVVNGICFEKIVISTDNLTFVGNSSGTNAEINGTNLSFPTLISIESAVRITISGFNINMGLFGVQADAGASFKITDSNISKMTIGMQLKNNSNVKIQNVSIDFSLAIGLDVTSGSTSEVTDSLDITNSGGFGLQVIDGAEMKVNKGAVVEVSNNILGGQISVGSSMFVDTGAKIIANNNTLIGFSINTGATVILFNADLSANGNGLDGLDVVSSASLDVDSNAKVTANNNRREGISVDDSSLNVFGFFSTDPDLPKIIANDNSNNGLQIEFGSKLDIGRNSSIETTGNGKAGILLDDGSSANIHDSVITGNNGMLLKEIKSGKTTSNEKAKGPADIIATYGSRISFRGNNEVGLVLCDKSSLARGDVKCKY